MGRQVVYKKNPCPTPSLGEYSNLVATTKWVKDISTAAVYVSPDGNDSNSGMTAAESVKTIGRAIAILNSIPKNGVPRIDISAGTYTESEITIRSRTYYLTLGGNVTINAPISFWSGGGLSTEGNYKLTINGLINIDESSYFSIGNGSFELNGRVNVFSNSLLLCKCSTSVNCSENGQFAFTVADGSEASFWFDTSITTSGTLGSIRCISGVYLYFGSTLNISATNTTGYLIHVENNAEMVLNGLIVSGSGNHGGFDIFNNSIVMNNHGIETNDYLTDGYCIHVSQESVFYCVGSINIYGSTTNSCLLARINSVIRFDGTASDTYTIHPKGSVVAITINEHSMFTVDIGTLKIEKASNYEGGFALRLYNSSSSYISNLDVSGKYSYFLSCGLNSSFKLPPDGTVVNNATGQRYIAAYGSQIEINGAGENRLPGDTPGFADTDSFAYYR